MRASGFGGKKHPPRLFLYLKINQYSGMYVKFTCEPNSIHAPIQTQGLDQKDSTNSDHSLYTTCLINGRAYLHSGMVSIIFFLTKYCCSSIPEVPSIVVNPSDWAIESYCSIILLWNIL
jgi:hypothetical protein